MVFDVRQLRSPQVSSAIERALAKDVDLKGTLVKASSPREEEQRIQPPQITPVPPDTRPEETRALPSDIGSLEPFKRLSRQIGQMGLSQTPDFMEVISGKLFSPEAASVQRKTEFGLREMQTLGAYKDVLSLINEQEQRQNEELKSRQDFGKMLFSKVLDERPGVLDAMNEQDFRDLRNGIISANLKFVIQNTPSIKSEKLELEKQRTELTQQRLLQQTQLASERLELAREKADLSQEGRRIIEDPEFKESLDAGMKAIADVNQSSGSLTDKSIAVQKIRTRLITKYGKAKEVRDLIDDTVKPLIPKEKSTEERRQEFSNLVRQRFTTKEIEKRASAWLKTRRGAIRDVKNELKSELLLEYPDLIKEIDQLDTPF